MPRMSMGGVYDRQVRKGIEGGRWADQRSLPGMKPFGNEFQTQLDAVGVIHVQGRDGGAAHGGPSAHVGAAPDEMFRPGVESRIEDVRTPVCPGIHACEIRSFVAIAAHAGNRKVMQGRGPLMLAAYDVIDVKGIGRRAPGQMAILATILRPLPHCRPQRPRNVHQPAFSNLRSERRARAWRIPRKSVTRT
jgi:hypothetical protein